jgi:methionine-rich copper-binding protein CopC
MKRALAVALISLCAVAAFGSRGTADAKAFFHAKLLKSSPADHDTIAGAPKVVALWYSEPVELSLSSGKLTDAKGATVALAKPTLASGDTAAVVYAIPKPPAPGSYKFAWTAAGKDGHASKGTIDFVIRATR